MADAQKRGSHMDLRNSRCKIWGFHSSEDSSQDLDLNFRNSTYCLLLASTYWL